MKLELIKNSSWYGVYLPLSLDGWDVAEVAAWCRQTFGSPGLRFDSYDLRWRDNLYDGTVYFRDEADRNLFILRWS